MASADRTTSTSRTQAVSGGQPFGKYRLLRLLARGGMAEVHLAEGPNPRNDELVCLKLMLPNLATDREFLSMFVEEAKLAAPLSHRNLVQIDDLGLKDGRLYLAMEYIRGHALSVLHRELLRKTLLMPPVLAAAAIAQACRGLDHAHDANGQDGRPLGLVHRDISPQNLILRFDGLVKVVDFGIAKATSVSGTRTTHLKGKLPYMSPEQINGRGIDRRTDVFAMGASLYELLCGRRLFTGKTDAELIRQIMFEPIRD
ncbi:MAG: serine/threonine protein kinase, partial [Myxococcales bacterium]